MKTTLIVVTVVICAVVAGVASNASRIEGETAVRVAAVLQKVSAAQAKIRQAEERIAAAEGEQAETQSVLAGWQKTKATNDNSAPRLQAAPAISAAELEKKLVEARQQGERPATQRLQLEERRAGLRPDYRQFFEKLRLSPAQIERFVEINLKRFAADMDISALVKQGVVAGSDPAVATLRADVKAEQDTAYRELLGESGFQQLEEEWRTEVAKGLVKGFAGMAVLEGVPFTAAQLQQLVQIVANADSSYRAGGRVSYSMATIDWDLVDAQVRPLMSEAQWVLFNNSANLWAGYNWAYSRCRSAIEKAAQADTAALKVAQAAKPPGG